MAETANLTLSAKPSSSQCHAEKTNRRVTSRKKEIAKANLEMLNEIISNRSSNVLRRYKNVQYSKVMHNKTVNLAICKPLSVRLTRLTDSSTKRPVKTSTISKPKKRRRLWQNGVTKAIRKKTKSKTLTSKIDIGISDKNEDNAKTISLPVHNTVIQSDTDDRSNIDVLNDERNLINTTVIPLSLIENVECDKMSGNNGDLACENRHDTQSDVFHAKQKCIESQDAEYPSESTQQENEYLKKLKFKRKRDIDMTKNAEKEKQSIIISKRRRRNDETAVRSATLRSRVSKSSNTKVIQMHRDKTYSQNRELFFKKPLICLTRLEQIDNDLLIKKWKTERLKETLLNMSNACSERTWTTNDSLDLSSISIAKRVENTEALENIRDNRDILNVQNVLVVRNVENDENIDRDKYASKENCNVNVQERECSKNIETIVQNIEEKALRAEAKIPMMDNILSLNDELINKHKLFKDPKVLLIGLKCFGSFSTNHYSACKVETLMDEYMDNLIKSSSPRLSSLYGSSYCRRSVEHTPSTAVEAENVPLQNPLRVEQNVAKTSHSLQNNVVEMENMLCQKDQEKQVSSYNRASPQPLLEEKQHMVNSNSNNSANVNSIKEFVLHREMQHSSMTKPITKSSVAKQNSNKPLQKQSEAAQKNLLEIWRNAFCSEKSREINYETSKAFNSTWSIPQDSAKPESATCETSSKSSISPHKGFLRLPKPTLQSSSVSTTSPSKPSFSKSPWLLSDSSVSSKSALMSQRSFPAKSTTDNESEVSSKETPLQHLPLEQAMDHSSFYDDDSRELVIDENPPDSTYTDENMSIVTTDKILRKDCNESNLSLAVKNLVPTNRDEEKQKNREELFSQSRSSKKKKKQSIPEKVKHTGDGLSEKLWKKHKDKSKSKSTKHVGKPKTVVMKNLFDKPTSATMTLKLPHSDVDKKITRIDKQKGEDLIDSSTEQSSTISSPPCNINEAVNQRKCKPIKIRISKGKSVILKDVEQTEQLPLASEYQTPKEVRAMYKCVVCDFKSDNFNDLQLHMLKLPCNDILLPNGSNESSAKASETLEEARSTANCNVASPTKFKKNERRSVVSQENQNTKTEANSKEPSVDSQVSKGDEASASNERLSKPQEETDKQKKPDATKPFRRKRPECYTTSLECNICSKVYDTKIDLANHIYTHTELELQQAYHAAKLKLITEKLEASKACSKPSRKEEESHTASTTDNPINENENEKTAKETEQKETEKGGNHETTLEATSEHKSTSDAEQRTNIGEGSDSAAARDEGTTLEEPLEQMEVDETNAETSKIDNNTSETEANAEQEMNNGQGTEILSLSTTSTEGVSPQVTKPITICECHNKEVTVENCLRIEVVLLCHVCQVLFRRVECLEMHYRRAEGLACNKNRRHGRSPKLFCTNCRVIFGSIIEVRQHLEMHARRNRSGVTDFRCNICKVIFIGIGSLFYVHWSYHVKNPFFLASKLSFPKSSVVDSKYLKTYGPTDKSEEVYIQVAEHICQVCRMPFGLSEELEKHERTCGKEKELEISTKKPDTEQSIKDSHATPDIRLICAICNEVFLEKSLFEQHARLHHNQHSHPQYICVALTAVKRVYICNVCASVQENISDLEEHWSKHRKINFICIECEKQCETLESFVEHTKEHGGKDAEREPLSCRVAYRDTKFVCVTCGWVLETEALLREHMLVHPQDLLSASRALENENDEQDSCEKNLVVANDEETLINVENAPPSNTVVPNLSDSTTKIPDVVAPTQSEMEDAPAPDYEVIILDESSMELESSKMDCQTDVVENIPIDVINSLKDHAYAENVKKSRPKKTGKPIRPKSAASSKPRKIGASANTAARPKSNNKNAEKPKNDKNKQTASDDHEGVIQATKANVADDTQRTPHQKDASPLKAPEIQNDSHNIPTDAPDKRHSEHQNDANEETPKMLRIILTGNDKASKKSLTSTENTSEKGKGDSGSASTSLTENGADLLASSKDQATVERKTGFLRVKTLAELTGETPEYACQACSLSFDSTDKLKQHSAIHDKDPVEAINIQCTPVPSKDTTSTTMDMLTGLVSTALTTNVSSSAPSTTQSALQIPPSVASTRKPQTEQQPTWHVCHSNPSSPAKPQDTHASTTPQNQAKNSSISTIPANQPSANPQNSSPSPSTCPLFCDIESSNPGRDQRENTATSQQSSTANVQNSNAATTTANSSSSFTTLVYSPTQLSKYNCAVCPNFRCNTVAEFLLHELTVEHETRKRSVQVLRMNLPQTPISGTASNTMNSSNVTMNTVPASAKPRVVDNNRSSSSEQIQNRGAKTPNVAPNTYHYRHIAPANNASTQQAYRPRPTKSSLPMILPKTQQKLRHPIWTPARATAVPIPSPYSARPEQRPPTYSVRQQQQPPPYTPRPEQQPPPYTPRPEQRPPQPQQEGSSTRFILLRDTTGIPINQAVASTNPIISTPQQNAAYGMMYTQIRPTAPAVQTPQVYFLTQNYQFTCPYCPNNLSFATEELMRHHFDLDHNFLCDICGQRMFNSNDLAIHRITHEIIWEASAFQNRNN